MNAETAFKRLFKGLAKFPRFKKKQDPEVKIYFPKNHATDLTVERHRIKVPTLGWVRLKEKGYIPTKGRVSSCTIEQKANRYYLSVLFKDVPTSHKDPEDQPYSEGIGLDMGIKILQLLAGENHSRTSTSLPKSN